MKAKINHIQINVSDFEKSKKFYSELFDILGWNKLEENEEEKFISWIYSEGKFSFWIFETGQRFNKNKFHRKNTGLNHLAFKVDSEEKVREFYERFLFNKKDIVLYGGPKEYPEYREGYFAVYFEDPDRIKLEINYYPE